MVSGIYHGPYQGLKIYSVVSNNSVAVKFRCWVAINTFKFTTQALSSIEINQWFGKAGHAASVNSLST